MMKRFAAFFLLSVLSMSLGACSSGFDAKWRAAGQRPSADAYSGRWAGRWQSTRGHGGDALECVFTKKTPAQYTADFHAHWHGLSSSYTVDFATSKSPTGLRFQGRQDLGFLQGGVYQYEGVVTPKRFSAKYGSKYDNGTFELQRLPAGR